MGSVSPERIKARMNEVEAQILPIAGKVLISRGLKLWSYLQDNPKMRGVAAKALDSVYPMQPAFRRLVETNPAEVGRTFRDEPVGREMFEAAAKKFREELTWLDTARLAGLTAEFGLLNKALEDVTQGGLGNMLADLRKRFSETLQENQERPKPPEPTSEPRTSGLGPLLDAFRSTVRSDTGQSQSAPRTPQSVWEEANRLVHGEGEQGDGALSDASECDHTDAEHDSMRLGVAEEMETYREKIAEAFGVPKDRIFMLDTSELTGSDKS